MEVMGDAGSPPRERRPRSFAGGRSARHSARHAQRGHGRENAPGWNDAAASAVLCALHVGATKGDVGITSHTRRILEDSALRTRFVSSLRLTQGSRDLVGTILEVHSGRVHALQGCKRNAAVRSFLKPLRERRGLRTKVETLPIPPWKGPLLPWTDWISKDPRTERLRDIRKSTRITSGLKQWPLEWLKEPGVVCYERAEGRVRRERGGVPDAAFLRGVVRTRVLPTALASTSDHYVLLLPGEEPRFFTVEEVARAFGIPPTSLLWGALSSGSALTPSQAVSCLGRAVQVDVARSIIALLMKRGDVRPGCLYASAYSGIDTIAAALDEELGPPLWCYEFASEQWPPARRALLEAWAPRGLTEERCFWDARSDTPVAMRRVTTSTRWTYSLLQRIVSHTRGGTTTRRPPSRRAPSQTCG